MSPPGLRYKFDGAHPARKLVLLEAPGLSALGAVQGYEPVRVPDWPGLGDAVRRALPSTVVLLDPFSADDSDTADSRVRELIHRTPSVPVVAAARVRAERLPAVRELLAWGVSELVDLELEGSEEMLLARLRAAHARPFKRRLEGGLSRYVSGNALILVRAAAEVVVDGGTRAEFAGRFGVTGRTTARWCEREGLPQPKRLLLWLRILLATLLLEEEGRSVRSVAPAAGYRDHSSLVRAFGVVLALRDGRPLREIPFALAMERFNSELRELRERQREITRARRIQAEGTRA